MLNKRTIIGVVSTGALLVGVGIARSAVTTERIVTDEALNLAQQTGQPVWETYKRHVWLAWVGSVIAVAGVSGVAASLYAREEEIEEITDRALGLRDQLASTVPALRSISMERRRELPPATSDVPLATDHPEQVGDDASSIRLKKSPMNPVTDSRVPVVPVGDQIADSIGDPIGDPIAPPSQPPSPLNLAHNHVPQTGLPTDLSPSPVPTTDPSHPPLLTTPDAEGSSSDTEWLNPLELRSNPSLGLPTEPDPLAPTNPLQDDASARQDLQELEPLFLSEPSLDDWGDDATQALALPEEADPGLFPSFPGGEAEKREGLAADDRAMDTVRDGDREEEENDDGFERLIAPMTLRHTEPHSNADVIPSTTQPTTTQNPTSKTWLASLVTAPLLCVCGDHHSDTIVVTKANVLRELIDRRLDRGHKCIVCDPYDEAKTWRGCDRLGQNEDFATIDVAIATIVAEIETRLEASQAGQVDFSPISLICFQPSDWIDHCTSAPLLAARTIDAARVAISLLLIETTPPKQWSAFGHSALSFPENAFIELELDISEVTPCDTTSPENSGDQDEPTTLRPHDSDDDAASPLPIAWLRDPTRPDAPTFETIALPDFNTPLFNAPPIRSRPPLTAPPVHPSSPSSQNLENLVNNLPPNQAENSYPMADSETEKQLRSQIALFQNLGMTREQIVVAVWDVRNPDSDEYEIASAFYDRLTR